MTTLSPQLAAAIHQVRVLDPRQTPMLAAHWLAEGHDGPALRELAGLRGHEREVTDLWPLALTELGVAQPLPGARRLALGWAAARVLAGERDTLWLVGVFWPELEDRDDDPGPRDVDDLVDRLVYSLDELLEALDRIEGCPVGRPLRKRRQTAQQKRAARMRQDVHAALEAFARDDLTAAAAVLGA